MNSTTTPTTVRCAECHTPSGALEVDVTGRAVCPGCFVPDIHSPAWPGYGLATEDVLVAAPNVRRVDPAALGR